MSDERVSLPGSEENFRAGERLMDDVSSDQQVTATVLLWRPPKAASEQDLFSPDYRPPAREAAEQELRADPADMKAVADFASQHGLALIDEDPGSRRIRVQGNTSQIASAFGVQLKWAEDAGGHRFLTYLGSISVPKQLSGIITAVLGLSQRAVAKHHS
ncbi:MAG TPA: protease pro-enzyme activation domain-containing protein [Bryobacteraceae bacterium]|jgi:kumamolisin|nr:protease pro-enzyme activation domain-containing protein [Bryobacteraceae bacterium]